MKNTQNYKVCEFCKQQYPSTEAYCPFCKDEKWNYCSDCGKTIPKGNKECECQTVLKKNNTIYTSCGEIEVNDDPWPSIH
ncbi:MAG: hypothetical protein R3Y43_00105 [Alphaproteobacteria bacterium]